MKTLYISDLDGTLLNNNAEMSSYAKESLNLMIKDGLHFSIATARTVETVKTILLGIDWSIPLILLSGVVIYDFTNRMYIETLQLDSKAVIEILKILKKCDTTGLMYQLQDNKQITYYETLHNKGLGDFIEFRQKRYNKEFIEVNSFFDTVPENIIYFTLYDTYEKLYPVGEALKDISDINVVVQKDNYSSDRWFLEICNSNASKKHAAEYLKETYGFDHLVGFGDNTNDLPLFSACDLKIAVENAFEEVKTVADQICETNYDDGVVRWLLSHYKED